MDAKEVQLLAERARLLSVLKRFPEDRAALQRLFRKDISFQELCRDYRDCLAALQQWKQFSSGESREMTSFYTELLGELEQEIRHFIKEEKAGAV